MPRNKVAPYETGSGAVLRLAPVDFDFDVEKLKVSGFVVKYFLISLEGEGNTRSTNCIILPLKGYPTYKIQEKYFS